jgi:hypothetical protein
VDIFRAGNQVKVVVDIAHAGMALSSSRLKIKCCRGHQLTVNKCKGLCCLSVADPESGAFYPRDPDPG